MKVGLVGFGKAGRAVAHVLLEDKNFSLEWVLRRKNLFENRSVQELLGVQSSNPCLIYSLQNSSIVELLKKHPVDLIIDFSSESGITFYGKEAAMHEVKIISAVSHYDEDTIALLKELAAHTVVFWSANITFGINYLTVAAKILKNIAPWADIKISEEHFREKMEISGTATIIAKELGIESNEINVSRIGGIVGKHEIVFGFPYQTVRLIHESISREAFGNGAIFVATHLANKKNGFYKFEDLLLPYLAGLKYIDPSTIALTPSPPFRG